MADAYSGMDDGLVHSWIEKFDNSCAFPMMFTVAGKPRHVAVNG